MAWTAPMTAVATATFTAAQFNTYIRNNILETMPAKAATVGAYQVTTPDGLSGIVERTVGEDGSPFLHPTASTTFADVTFPVIQVTRTTGNQAMVYLSSQIQNDAVGAFGIASVDISGATTIAASDNNSINFQQVTSAANQVCTSSKAILFDLTPGVNTFTMKFRVTSGNGAFTMKNMIVLPL